MPTSVKTRHDVVGRHASLAKLAPPQASPPSRVATSWRVGQPEFLAPTLAVLVTMLAYLRSVGGGFVFDDRAMIVDNPTLRQWSFLWQAFFRDFWYFAAKDAPLPYFRPLENAWMSINFHLFGLNAAGWHAGVVLLHLIAVWLLYRFAVRLGLNPWSAGAAAALFGVAPIHAQAVSWIAALSYPGLAVLDLAALLSFTNAKHTTAQRFGWSLTACWFALLTHEMAIVFPVLIAAYVFLLEPDLQSSSTAVRIRRAVLAAAPFVGLVLIYLATRLLVLGFVNRAAANNHATLAECLLSVPGAVWNYLALFALPWRAGLSQPFQLVRSATSAGFILPVAGLLALAAALYELLRQHPRRSLYLFLLTWMAAALAPALYMRNYPPDFLVQDRYFYWSSAALCILLADLGASLAAASAATRRFAAAAAVAVLGFLAVVLWRVERYWHDEIALFGRCVDQAPNSPICHNRLGLALEEAGDQQGAERELARTLQLDPENYGTLYDLGQLHNREGRAHEAEGELSRALEHTPDAPPSFYLELASAAQASGDPATADQAFAVALKDPTNAPRVAMIRAQFAARQGDLAGAESALQALTVTHPEFAEGWGELASVVLEEGDPEQALNDVEHAIALAPATPSFHLVRAAILHRLGRDSDALAECQSIINARSGDPHSRQVAQQIASTLSASDSAAR